MKHVLLNPENVAMPICCLEGLSAKLQGFGSMHVVSLTLDDKVN